jgi:two-component system chemotaxis response regulator CheB
MIKVLIVDDSRPCRELLAQILAADPKLHVVGFANSGREALDAVARLNPQVVVMDTEMPQTDGFEATRSIMETQPLPVVILSTHNSSHDSERALAVGAVATVNKPVSPADADYGYQCRRLIQTVKLMSEVKMVKRWTAQRRHAATQTTVSASASPSPGSTSTKTIQKTEDTTENEDYSSNRFVVIGASTGGPPVLRTILADLPPTFPAPILIVQHIAPGFLEGLRTWLEETTQLPIHIPTSSETPLPGHVYLAPDGQHMGLDAQGRIILSTQEPENGLQPAVSFLFRSAAMFHGLHSVGVLLTGMGKDGAEQLGQMRARGAITIAQDESTSVVHGMPGEAIRLNAAMHILEADKIAPMLARLVTTR